jgi:hypothetical protein
MINVTQEQKEFLNSLGIQVIEFKRLILKMQKIIEDTMRALAEAVKEVAEVVIKPLVDKAAEYLKSDKISTRDKYKLCK